MHSFSLLEFDELNSTNEYLKQNGAFLKDGTVVLARRQTGGKGRMGRSFLSPEGGLYFSLLLKPDCLLDVSLCTVAAAVACTDALYSLGIKNTLIKWVNDIFVDGKKVCGILAEGVFGEPTFFVLGVGVNLLSDEKIFLKENINAASLFKEGDFNTLKDCFLKEFIDRFYTYISSNGESYLKKYREKNMLLNKTVTYLKNGEKHIAKCVGIDDKGRLLVKENGKETALFSGEVTFNGN